MSWRFYAPSTDPIKGGGIWSAFDAIQPVRRGPEWATNVISPETQVLTDIQAGTLANVTWIVPDFKNSDHTDFRATGGPAWITSIVDTIGASSFWNSTAIFILWDDWGGWYDPVSPQYLDYDGLGFRVPLMVVSPYALTNNVTHTPYEFGSVLRWIENNWSLGQLAPSDKRATPFGADVFNFARAPRAFKRLGPAGEAARFIHEKPSLIPPDND